MPALNRLVPSAILAAAPAVASLIWLAGGLMLPAQDTSQELNDRLSVAQPSPARRPGPLIAPDLSTLLSRPLFAPTPASPGGQVELHLQGLAQNGGRSAALIAIGDRPAVWVAVGETRDGVTLRRVADGGALVETISGDHSLKLGGDRGAQTLHSGAPTSALQR